MLSVVCIFFLDICRNKLWCRMKQEGVRGRASPGTRGSTAWRRIWTIRYKKTGELHNRHVIRMFQCCRYWSTLWGISCLGSSSMGFYLKLFCPDGVFYCIVTLLKALVLRSILFFLQGCVPSIPLFSFFCVGGGVGVSQSALLMWRHSKRNEGNIWTPRLRVSC